MEGELSSVLIDPDGGDNLARISSVRWESQAEAAAMSFSRKLPKRPPNSGGLHSNEAEKRT